MIETSIQWIRRVVARLADRAAQRGRLGQATYPPLALAGRPDSALHSHD